MMSWPRRPPPGEDRPHRSIGADERLARVSLAGRRSKIGPVSLAGVNDEEHLLRAGLRQDLFGGGHRRRAKTSVVADISLKPPGGRSRGTCRCCGGRHGSNSRKRFRLNPRSCRWTSVKGDACRPLHAGEIPATSSKSNSETRRNVRQEPRMAKKVGRPVLDHEALGPRAMPARTKSTSAWTVSNLVPARQPSSRSPAGRQRCR